MDFLSQKQMLIFTSKKYEPIYMLLNKEYDFPYHKLFILCASLGASKGKASELDGKGREFRSNYFNNDERNLIYSIILNDEMRGKNIEKFNESSFHAEARNIIENYAEGGMDILVEEVFKEKWDNHQLDSKYKDYHMDILKYVLANLKEIPF